MCHVGCSPRQSTLLGDLSADSAYHLTDIPDSFEVSIQP